MLLLSAILYGYVNINYFTMNRYSFSIVITYIFKIYLLIIVKMNRTYKILVIGLGYVGLPLLNWENFLMFLDMIITKEE